MKCAYLAAEGVHDVTFLGRLLTKQLGFAQVQDRPQLDARWTELLSNYSLPMKRRVSQQVIEDISRLSVPAPVFFQSSEWSLAISNAEGISNLIARIQRDLEPLFRAQLSLDAIGVFLDSDAEPPMQRFATLRRELQSKVTELPSIPESVGLGDISPTTPQVGVFSMPHPKANGTLEDLLLDCAQHVYPSLLGEARQLVDRRSEFLTELNKNEREEICKPAGAKKAMVAVLGAFLKPGKPISASLQDHRWVSEQTLLSPALRPLLAFLTKLLEQPTPRPTYAQTPPQGT
jgi:hypothetical protein